MAFGYLIYLLDFYLNTPHISLLLAVIGSNLARIWKPVKSDCHYIFLKGRREKTMDVLSLMIYHL